MFEKCTKVLKTRYNLNDIKLRQTNVKNSPSQQPIACNGLVVVMGVCLEGVEVGK
jgi:hypothetical protein